MDICSHCGGRTNNYKCKQCGKEMLEKEPYHPCSREMVQLKCSAYNRAEDNYICK